MLPDNAASLNNTVFGVPNVSMDRSDFSSVFSFDIPDSKFRCVTKANGVLTKHSTTATATGYCDSVDGELLLKTGPANGDFSVVYSRRHPKLHPNRGKKISPSVFFDTAILTGVEHEIGLVNFDNNYNIIDGVTIALKDKKLYARIYSLGINYYNEEIPAEDLALFGIDPTKGHLQDIQVAWRGVGDMNFYLSNKKTSKPEIIHIAEFLNARNKLTISNPALHAAYIVRNFGNVAQLRSGCIDVSTESTDDDKQEPVFIRNVSDVASIPAGGKVLLAIRSPMMFKSKYNTRDSQFYGLDIYSAAKGTFEIYRINDSTRLTKGALVQLADVDWTDGANGSSLQYISNHAGLITGFDKTGISPFGGGGIEADKTYPFRVLNPIISPVDLVQGEALVIVGYGNNITQKIDMLQLGEEV